MGDGRCRERELLAAHCEQGGRQSAAAAEYDCELGVEQAQIVRFGGGLVVVWTLLDQVLVYSVNARHRRDVVPGLQLHASRRGGPLNATVHGPSRPAPTTAGGPEALELGSVERCFVCFNSHSSSRWSLSVW